MEIVIKDVISNETEFISSDGRKLKEDLENVMPEQELNAISRFFRTLISNRRESPLIALVIWLWLLIILGLILYCVCLFV